MATVKKSKKKIIIPICIVLVIAIASASVFAYAKTNNGKNVTLHTIGTDDIYETVSLTGDVTAGTTREYKVSAVATVKEVFVKVGDQVKKDDLLATFDVTALNEEISSLQTSYDQAVISYNDSVKTQKEAKVKVKAIEEEIKETEKKIAELQAKVEAAKPSTTAPSQTTTENVTVNGVSAYNNLSASPAAVSDPITGDLADSIRELNETLAKITQDIAILAESVQIIAGIVADIQGSLDPEELTKIIVDALVQSGIAEDIARQIVSAIDLEAMTRTMMESDNTQLTAAQIQLLALEGQHAIYDAQADESIVNANKTAAEATKKALDILKRQQKEMSQGWKAAFDGTITAVDITAGMQTTMLTTGITLEDLSAMSVTVSLGEYDLHKVKVGMPATVKTAYGTYSGEVTFIAPTATGGSTSGLLDNVGSMAGISGLSSLTASSAGVECVISLPETDENIIAGFTAEVQIATGEYLGVTAVPIESIKLEKTGAYVYLYDAEESTVTKTKIETGSSSDTVYEVKSGLSVGDQIIAAPESNYEEETFDVKVVTNNK